MSPRLRLRTGRIFLALAGWLSASAAGAAPLYTLTNLGAAQNTAPYDGLPYIGFDANGQVAQLPVTSHLQSGGFTVQFGYNSSYSDLENENASISVNNGPSTVIPGVLGDKSTVAFGVNSSGTVVGSAYHSTTLAPFGDALVYTAQGGLQLLPTLFRTSGAALAINDQGQIVGTSTESVGARAFLSDGTKATDLNTLIAPGSGLTLIEATGINDQGQIVGVAEDSKGIYYDYLLTPIPIATPEPTVLMMAILVGAGFSGRRIAKLLL